MTTFSCSARELRWFIARPQCQQPRPLLRRWLLDTSSLTAKLIQLSQGEFRVQVLRQERARARRDEARALGIPFYSLCLVREVLLMGRNQPWVFARSVLPLQSLSGRLRRLRKQGSKPLGAFLFSQPQLQRSPIALAAISRHHGYVPPTFLDSKPVWGRRSIFYVDAKPLLVSEVFLADFLGAIDTGH